MTGTCKILHAGTRTLQPSTAIWCLPSSMGLPETVDALSLQSQCDIAGEQERKLRLPFVGPWQHVLNNNDLCQSFCWFLPIFTPWCRKSCTGRGKSEDPRQTEGAEKRAKKSWDRLLNIASDESLISKHTLVTHGLWFLDMLGEFIISCGLDFPTLISNHTKSIALWASKSTPAFWRPWRSKWDWQTNLPPLWKLQLGSTLSKIL